MYKVTARTQTIAENTTILPDNASGWMVQNLSSENIAVNGYTLKPYETLDYTHIHPDVVWNSEITIEALTSAAVKARLTRLYYTQA